MPSNFKLTLSAPPDLVQDALTFRLPVAHMAYRIGPGLRLLRSKLPATVRGGLMMADDSGSDGRGTVASFCQDVLRECAGRGFEGIILDFERPPSPLLGKVVSELAVLTEKRNLPLYVPEAYASCSNQTKVIISSALSGGSLRQRLSESAETYGAGRVILGVERVAEDFFLPAPNGQGTPLSREALKKRLAERSPTVFFSRELCAHYFTYMSKQSGAHFVLFDDAASIRQKLKLAGDLKIQEAMLAYPQVDDLLAQILD